MKIMEVMRSSARLAWQHKALWVFGFFTAATGGGAGSSSGQGDAAGLPGLSGAALPLWLLPAIGAAALLGLFGLIAHVVSEAALIDAVERTERGERYGFGSQVRRGLRDFWSVLGIKAAFAVAAVLSVFLMIAPALLGVLQIAPLPLGALGSAALGLVGVPWILTLYCWHQYALRVAVLEHAGPGAALRGGWDHLHGRVGASIELMIAGLLGDAAVGVGGLLALLVAGALGGVVYLLAGLVPAVVVGAALVVPAAVALVGAVGTYRSTVWTLGFLHTPTAAPAGGHAG